MKTATVFLAAVLVLGSASLASAECAWVFWIKKEDQSFGKQPQFSIFWELMSARPTREECLDVKARVWETVADRYSDLSKYPGVEKVDTVPHKLVITTLKEGRGDTTKTFFCLPDTIDPREKKE